MAREYTNRMLEMVEEGYFDKDMLIRDLLSWMSEHEVREFVDANRFFADVDADIEEDVDEAQEWHDFDPDC